MKLIKRIALGAAITAVNAITVTVRNARGLALLALATIGAVVSLATLGVVKTPAMLLGVGSVILLTI